MPTTKGSKLLSKSDKVDNKKQQYKATTATKVVTQRKQFQEMTTSK